MKKSVSSQRVCPMDEHERFVKFYDTIPEILHMYTSNFTWVVGLLTVANGWILSSETTRNFINSNKYAYLGVVIVVAAIGLTHTAACWYFYQLSQKRIAELTGAYEDLYPLPFEHYKISRPIFLMNLLISWSLVFGLIAMVIIVHAS